MSDDSTPAGRHRYATEAAARRVETLKGMLAEVLIELGSAIAMTNEALGDSSVESAINIHQAMWALETNLMPLVGQKVEIWESELERYRRRF